MMIRRYFSIELGNQGQGLDIQLPLRFWQMRLVMKPDMKAWELVKSVGM